ncbi:hypothetical protein J6590_063531 [Homalodisca vitripennis]|nr:hypothetical protein J6590_063531 [Homalodisca vitripennis]
MYRNSGTDSFLNELFTSVAAECQTCQCQTHQHRDQASDWTADRQQLWHHCLISPPVPCSPRSYPTSLSQLPLSTLSACYPKGRGSPGYNGRHGKWKALHVKADLLYAA